MVHFMSLGTAALFATVLANEDAFGENTETFRLVCLTVYSMYGPSKRLKSASDFSHPHAH